MRAAPPKTEARRRGDFGERAAARYLRLRFYRILNRNWFFYRKEIDIIAKRGATLVFCEVKTRTYETETSPYGPPSVAVNDAKQHNIIVAAEGYVRAIGWRGNVRMDVIEVYLKKDSSKKKAKVSKIVHIRNAFTA